MDLRPYIIPVLLCLACISWPTAAEIFKTVDEHGKVTYTDNPKDKPAEDVTLKRTNIQPAVKPKPPVVKAAESEEEVSRYSLAIRSPTEGTRLSHGDQVLHVSVSISPELSSEHGLQATLNGEPHGPIYQSTDLVLDELYRGTYQLGVRLLNRKGEVLAQAQPVTIHIQRISINSPARRGQ